MKGFVSGLVFLFLVMGVCFAEEPESFVICDHRFVQSEPSVSEGYVVWQDRLNGDDDIYGKDFNSGGEAKIICGEAEEQSYPQISGDIVVWQDYRNGNYDIYGYDLGRDVGVEIFVGPGNQVQPSVSGDIVVWRNEPNDGGDGDIYGYNMVTDCNFVICDDPGEQYWPVVDCNMVVWIDVRNSNFDIYGYDIDAGVERAICTEGSEQFNPDIDNGYVVWEDGRNPLTSKDIYGRDFYGSGDGEAICTDADKQQMPSICGDVVIWQDKRNYSYSNYDIYYCWLDEKVARPLRSADELQDCPDCDGGLAVWKDNLNGTDSDIYGALLPVPSEILLTDPNGGERYAAGALVPVRWASSITPAGWVNVEVSTDGGYNFELVAERVANTGEYDWQTEDWRDSQECVVRVSDAAYWPAADESDGVFAIYQCDPNLTGDITGDCVVNMDDFRILSKQWLQRGDPNE